MPARLRNLGLCLFAFCLSLSIAGANIGWVVLLGAIVVGGGLKGLREGVLKDPLFKPWTAYLGVAAAAAALGISPSHSLKGLPTEIARVAAYFVLSHALREGLAKPRPAVRCYAAGAAAAALYGLWQVGATYSAGGGVAFAHGTVHHVTYGELMAFALSLCLSAALWTTKTRFWGWAGAVVLLDCALLASQTRGAWLATAAAWAGSFLWYRKGRGRVLALAGLNALVFALALLAASRFAPAASLAQRAKSVLSTSFHSNRDRLTAWKVSLQVFRDHPLLGVGPGCFREVFADYHDAPIQGERRWGNVHNLYLHQLAERGLLGVLALAWLFASMAALAWRRRREAPSAWRLHALAFLPGFFVMNLTETSFQHEIIAYNLCWLLALGSVKGPA